MVTAVAALAEKAFLADPNHSPSRRRLTRFVRQREDSEPLTRCAQIEPVEVVAGLES
jgi:hypothetical protein